MKSTARYGLSGNSLSKDPGYADRDIPETSKGEIIVIQNAFRDPRIEYSKEVKQKGIASVLFIPILSNKKVSGVLRVSMC